ncbi:hypothetical protein PJF56_12540 [Roseofilum sp. BLCC_M91]|uniref:Uncharacterized protein n=1 Tax=Roseofilum halophilum BLCC-M91 TaxID=3022259 RepID=A0ABT7BLQ8_9CYAN|nr:hypothetical protein [Roseofilum halophilum]MDJ1179692.1 hypothetical protein [Roseofilum halophilum BLCC-M91]
MKHPPEPNPDAFLLAPNLYLWAYQLADKKTDATFWNAANLLLSRFGKTLEITEREKSRVLLAQGSSIGFKLQDSPEISGYLQPLKLKDSYAVRANLGYDDEQDALDRVDVQQLSALQFNWVPPQENFLGQTLLVTAYLSRVNQQRDLKKLRNLADHCYQVLFTQSPQFCRQGTLFGSPIFEYNPTSEDDTAPHVLIWLFRDEEAQDKINTCMSYFTDLLFYRAKIVKAFQNSRSMYDQLDRAYNILETKLDNLQKELDRHNDASRDDYLESFKTSLKYFAQESLPYTRNLGKLEDFKKTIAINVYNYNEQVAQICDRLGLDKEELSFIQQFSDNKGQHFDRQIEADLGYFNNGIDLFNTAIASIRGTVEIDQAESDRNLEHQIQTFGSAIAVGAIVASTSTLIFQEPWTLPWQEHHGDRPHPFIIALLVSFAFALLAWGGVKLLIWCSARRRSGRKNP